jgi:hypothetical protein
MNDISEINNEEKIIKQWVSEVIEFSSQYNDVSLFEVTF